MSFESVTNSLPVRAAKQTAAHPFAPLSKQEITSAVALIKGRWPADTDLQFKIVTLEEPAKAEAVPYIEAEHNGQNLPSIDRRALVAYYIRKTVSSRDLLVDIGSI